MKRIEALRELRQIKPLLLERFGVARLSIFGSTARDTASPTSDVDVLVEFNSPATAKSYFGLQFMLEDHLGVSVDLVTYKALRSELKPYIESDLIDV